MDDGARNRAQLALEGLAVAGQGWQQRKSVQTRVAILDAAIKCLQEYGYARTTTQLIALAAGISRGAMLHHYATKQDLISTVIDYTFYKRMESFTAAIDGLSENDRVVRQVGLELFWETLLTPEYSAYLELTVAARTDKELHEIFIPKARRYDEIWRLEIARIFPEWSDQPEKLSFAVDYCLASYEGLLLNREVWDDRARRVRLRAFVTLTIGMIRDNTLQIPEATLTIKKPRRTTAR